MKTIRSITRVALLAALAATAQPSPFVLHDGTPVRLRLGRNLSSHDAQTGETVDFEVLDDVLVNDHIVIQRGSTALATVTEAQAKRRVGRGGKLDVTLDSVRLVDGDKGQISGISGIIGMLSGAAMYGAVPALEFFYFKRRWKYMSRDGKIAAAGKVIQ
jgi:hypothetical protein